MAEFFDIVIVVERDRKTKYDIGAFATYATGVGSNNAGKIHAWGEAWISRIGSLGNMRVSGSKGRE